MSPHVYDIAQSALVSQQRSHNNQSIIISGESGSGKVCRRVVIIKYIETCDIYIHTHKSGIPLFLDCHR